MNLFFADGTPVVMGTAGEITPGAILFVSGVATKHEAADVKKVIIVTKYVRLE